VLEDKSGQSKNYYWITLGPRVIKIITIYNSKKLTIRTVAMVASAKGTEQWLTELLHLIGWSKPSNIGQKFPIGLWPFSLWCNSPSPSSSPDALLIRLSAMLCDQICTNDMTYMSSETVSTKSFKNLNQGTLTKRGRLSTVELHVLTSLDQLLLILKNTVCILQNKLSY
jgi:hypothetical protein